MTFTSVAQANSKTAEFARLFDLFDRVATRRTRPLTRDPGEVISADDIANVPAQFAPVLNTLSTILSLRALRDQDNATRAETVSRTKACSSNALACVPSTTARAEKKMLRADVAKSKEEAEGNLESPTFPFGDRFPFTFKLMLHKLYDPDEWVEKVKDAVETSRSQFKPLAERVQNAVNLDVTANNEMAEKRRTIILPVLRASAKFKPQSATRLLPATAPSRPETSRVLKKRCIGRRKSINGPISNGVWVYDAVISATEVTGPLPAVEVTLCVPRDPRCVIENRARHHSLSAWEEAQSRVTTARRKVKITVPLLLSQEEISGPAAPKTSVAKVVRDVIEMESMVKRKKSGIGASESYKRAAVKRPLSF